MIEDDITGQVFGDLTAIGRVGSKLVGYGTKRRSLWEFRCVCGETVLLARNQATTGHTKSCGCMRKRRRHWNESHGAAKGGRTRTYQCWIAMRTRSYRGVPVPHDPRWDDFATFLADMGECPDGLTLDRTDHRGPYSRDNCRWADRKTQARNRRNTRFIEFHGEHRPIAEWAEMFGLPYGTVMQRLQKRPDLPPEKVFAPLRKPKAVHILSEG